MGIINNIINLYPQNSFLQFFWVVIIFVMFMIFTVIIPTESPMYNEDPVQVVDSVIENLRADYYRKRFGSLEALNYINEQFNYKIALKDNHDEETDIIVDIEKEKENLFEVNIKWEEENESYSAGILLEGD